MAKLLAPDTQGRLKNLCKEHGFTSRGRVFFRIHGDTILQAIQFCYERVFTHYSLDVGLMSLYSEARDSEFTAQTGLTKYSICCLDNCATAVTMGKCGEFVTFSVRSPESQLCLLEERGFEWLDSIVTQEQLLCAYDFLEKVSYKDQIWNNSFKLAPFLAIEDYDSADLVIASILNQHLGPKSFSPPPWSEEDFLYYSKHYPNKDENFLRIHNLIANKNKDAINAYLEENFKKNIDRLRFLRK